MLSSLARIGTGALVAAALAAGEGGAARAAQEAASPVVISRPQKITIKAIPLEEAVGLFRAVCPAAYPDSAAFDRAVEGLNLGFEMIEEGPPGPRVWKEGERYFILDAAPGEQGCSFRVAIEEQFSRDDLIGRLGEALAPGRPLTDRDFFAYWDLGENGCRIEYLPASEDLRLFTIMLRSGEAGKAC